MDIGQLDVGKIGEGTAGGESGRVEGFMAAGVDAKQWYIAAGQCHHTALRPHNQHTK